MHVARHVVKQNYDEGNKNRKWTSVLTKTTSIVQDKEVSKITKRTLNTYENRAVFAKQKRKPGGNVYSRRGNVVSNRNNAVTFVRSEWKEDVWNKWISEAIDWDSEQGHEEQR